MQDMITETEEQIRQLRPAPTPSKIIPEIRPAETFLLAAPEPATLTVSAIVPLYNGAHFIVRALKSILGQTVKPKELIVVDDGSTDDGPEVVKDFIANTDLQGIEFRFLHKTNGGQSSARNLGVEHATGDLIGFLDQDDEWYPLHIEKLRQPFIDQPAGPPLGWVYSNLDHADGNGKVMFRNWLPATEHPKKDLFACIAGDMFVLPSASLILRSAFNEVGGFDVNLSGYEDDDLFSRIFQSYGNVFINEPLSKWCIHHNSSSYSFRMRRSRDYYGQKLLARFPDDPRRTIYYARDLILPRFYPQAMLEFREALVSGDPQRIADTHASVRILLQHAERHGIFKVMSARKAKRLNRLLGVVTPRRAPMFYAIRRFVRPLARRAFA